MDKLLEIKPVEDKESILIEATEVEYESSVVQASQLNMIIALLLSQ